MQELADNYSHSLAIPTEMVLHNKTFISYKVTNFIWSKDFVAFEATSTFKAEINGQNVTYIPNEESKTTSSIPIGQWPQSSASDQQSNLLQGNYYLLATHPTIERKKVVSSFFPFGEETMIIIYFLGNLPSDKLSG